MDRMNFSMQQQANPIRRLAYEGAISIHSAKPTRSDHMPQIPDYLSEQGFLALSFVRPDKSPGRVEVTSESPPDQ